MIWILFKSWQRIPLLVLYPHYLVSKLNHEFTLRSEMNISLLKVNPCLGLGHPIIGVKVVILIIRQLDEIGTICADHP